MFQTKVVEKIKTHISCLLTFFFKKNSTLHEIMWENIVEPVWSRMKIWRMRITCWTPKATNTHPECVTIIAFQLQQWLQVRASMLRTVILSGCTRSAAAAPRGRRLCNHRRVSHFSSGSWRNVSCSSIITGNDPMEPIHLPF